jgi:hypothetical protein
MIASKLASDFATSIEKVIYDSVTLTDSYPPHIDFSHINPQIYARQTLIHLGKVSASIIVGKYFNAG